MRPLHVPLVTMFALALGCASSGSVPAQPLATARAAIRAADEAGAEHNPTAALHLRYAREQYTQAEALLRDGRNERARSVLLRAEADAELAHALAHEAASETEAQHALDQVRALQMQHP